MILKILILTLISILPAGAAWSQPGGADRPIPVVITVVEKKDFYNELEALGTLQANEHVELMSTVTERVIQVNFKDNQRVKKGDVLVLMDDAEEQALKDEEESLLDEAKKQVVRLRPLAERGAARASEFDERSRQVKAAQARLKAIEARINQRRIKAPFDGVVGLRNISPGALIQPGTLITTVDDNSVMKLDFSVPAVFLSTTLPGVKITAETRAFPDEKFSGTISSVDSRVDPITRSIVVRAFIDNPGYKLKPGLLMRVVLEKNPRRTLAIPEEAIITDGEQKYVFMVVNQEEQLIIRRQNVGTGTRKKGYVEILSGLKEKDRVVTHGSVRLRPGAKVSILSKQKGEEPLKDLIQGN